jgi:hypothetical protein
MAWHASNGGDGDVSRRHSGAVREWQQWQVRAQELDEHIMLL